MFQLLINQKLKYNEKYNALNVKVVNVVLKQVILIAQKCLTDAVTTLNNHEIDVLIIPYSIGNFSHFPVAHNIRNQALVFGKICRFCKVSLNR